MSDRVLTYECHVGDAAHDVPGPDVRILKTGDGGFIVACGCGQSRSMTPRSRHTRLRTTS